MSVNESISVREVRKEGELNGAIETRQQSVLMALDTRSPGCVAVADRNRVKPETDLDVLRRWLSLAITAPTAEAFQAGIE